MSEIRKLEALCILLLFLSLIFVPFASSELENKKKGSCVYKQEKLATGTVDIEIYVIKANQDIERVTKNIPLSDFNDLLDEIHKIDSSPFNLNEKIKKTLGVFRGRDLVSSDVTLNDIWDGFNTSQNSQKDNESIDMLFQLPPANITINDTNCLLFFCLTGFGVTPGLRFVAIPLLSRLNIDLCGAYCGCLWSVQTKSPTGPQQSIRGNLFGTSPYFYVGGGGYLGFAGILCWANNIQINNWGDGIPGGFLFLGFGMTGMTKWMGWELPI